MAGRRGINAFARRAVERAAGRIALRAAGWAVAYVLVLQVVLAGFALGSMPIGMDPALCLGAAASDRTTPDGGHDGDPAAHSHCQACLARADLPALPPPPPVPAAAPLTGALRLDFSAPSVAHHAYVLSAFRARAPPASA
ncbi:DUF2946 family protein [Xanthobacter flavus]|uniref:DUF2946 family protein n=1 Tax=Xanthobacter flavus TaxID=281 RepID=UPI001AE9A1AE|nr:DUF2946 family protein [Xanthobacter flavus]MBP2148591.1 hypothetical protein [Xanthobacter flavus]